jgi:hypothetical protein
VDRRGICKEELNNLGWWSDFKSPTSDETTHEDYREECEGKEVDEADGVLGRHRVGFEEVGLVDCC